MTSNPSPPQKTSITKVVSASLIGTTIEWYDFFLYGAAAALVFNHLFFPAGGPLVGTLLAFATFTVGFIARPLGGLVFGHFGDRIGRKQLLVVSLLLMGGATVAMGLLPTYQTVGVAAPIMLTLLRLIQGFALGGEWGGAVLLVSEHGDAKRRGFWASWPQAGAPGGNLLATAVLAVLAAVQTNEAFLGWGWRIPFLLSGLLVIIGLWIRISVSESPVFQEAAESAKMRAKPERAPIVTVITKQWREVLIAMGARFGENVSYYVITVFILVYVTQSLEMPESVGLNAVLIGSAIQFFAIPLFGALSDRFGRRSVYSAGAIGMALWIFAFFALLETKSPMLIIVATTVALLMHAAMYGPQAAYFSELFGTRVRYSGSSIGYQLASILAGGLAPVIATTLLSGYNSFIPIGIYVALASLVTIVALILSRETQGTSLAVAAEENPAKVAAGESPST